MYSSRQSDMNKDVRGRESSQQGLPNLNGPGLLRTLLNALNQGLSEPVPQVCNPARFSVLPSRKTLSCAQKCGVSTWSDRNPG